MQSWNYVVLFFSQYSISWLWSMGNNTNFLFTWKLYMQYYLHKDYTVYSLMTPHLVHDCTANGKLPRWENHFKIILSFNIITTYLSQIIEGSHVIFSILQSTATISLSRFSLLQNQLGCMWHSIYYVANCAEKTADWTTFSTVSTSAFIGLRNVHHLSEKIPKLCLIVRLARDSLWLKIRPVVVHQGLFLGMASLVRAFHLKQEHRVAYGYQLLVQECLVQKWGP